MRVAWLLGPMSEKGKYVSCYLQYDGLFSNTPPQTFVNTSLFIIFWCPSRVSGFVNLSASISVVGT